MRCKGVLLKVDGMKGDEIASIVGYGKIAVYNCVRRYEKDGIIKTAKAAWQEDSKREVSDSTFKRFLELQAQDINV